MRIFVLGFMGSGKSTIGRKLADTLSFKFIDADNYIESQQGATISNIFKRQGEEKFRAIEKSTLQEFVECENVVISTGGGMPCSPENMNVINESGISIYLYTRISELTNRLMGANQRERPLIEKFNNEDALYTFIKDKLVEREQFYFAAQLLIDANNSPLEIIQDIQNELEYFESKN